MRSKTLALAIGTACATWAAGSILFMPGAARAQSAATAPASGSANLPATSGFAAQRLTLSEALSLAESANPTLRAKQAQC